MPWTKTPDGNWIGEKFTAAECKAMRDEERKNNSIGPAIIPRLRALGVPLVVRHREDPAPQSPATPSPRASPHASPRASRRKRAD